MKCNETNSFSLPSNYKSRFAAKQRYSFRFLCTWQREMTSGEEKGPAAATARPGHFDFTGCALREVCVSRGAYSAFLLHVNSSFARLTD